MANNETFTSLKTRLDTLTQRINSINQITAETSEDLSYFLQQNSNEDYTYVEFCDQWEDGLYFPSNTYIKDPLHIDHLGRSFQEKIDFINMKLFGQDEGSDGLMHIVPKQSYISNITYNNIGEDFGSFVENPVSVIISDGEFGKTLDANWEGYFKTIQDEYGDGPESYYTTLTVDITVPHTSLIVISGSVTSEAKWDYLYISEVGQDNYTYDEELNSSLSGDTYYEDSLGSYITGSGVNFNITRVLKTGTNRINIRYFKDSSVSNEDIFNLRIMASQEDVNNLPKYI